MDEVSKIFSHQHVVVEFILSLDKSSQMLSADWFEFSDTSKSGLLSQDYFVYSIWSMYDRTMFYDWAKDDQ